MPTNAEYVKGIEHELDVMGEPFSDQDHKKVAELRRLLPIFQAGQATKSDRSAAGRVLHASWIHMVRM